MLQKQLGEFGRVPQAGALYYQTLSQAVRFPSEGPGALSQEHETCHKVREEQQHGQIQEQPLHRIRPAP